jgi:hypothetical protein
MEEKLNKIIEMLENIDFRLQVIEVEIEELKNGETEITAKQKVAIAKHSQEVSELRKKQLLIQDDKA